MRRVALAVGALAACAEPEHGTAPPDAFMFPQPPATPVTLTWTLQHADGTPDVCPPNSTAEVIIWCGRLGGSVQPGPSCETGTVATGVAPQPRDSCGIGVQIRDAAGKLFATTIPTFVPATGVLTTVHHDVITDRGRLQTHWKITKGGLVSNCQVVDVQNVSIEVTTPGGMGTSFMTDCSSTSAATAALPTGPAHVTITAGSVSASQDVEVPTGMLTAELPPLTLAFP